MSVPANGQNLRFPLYPFFTQTDWQAFAATQGKAVADKAWDYDVSLKDPYTKANQSMMEVGICKSKSIFNSLPSVLDTEEEQCSPSFSIARAVFSSDEADDLVRIKTPDGEVIDLIKEKSDWCIKEIREEEWGIVVAKDPLIVKPAEFLKISKIAENIFECAGAVQETLKEIGLPSGVANIAFEYTELPSVNPTEDQQKKALENREYLKSQLPGICAEDLELDLELI